MESGYGNSRSPLRQGSQSRVAGGQRNQQEDEETQYNRRRIESFRAMNAGQQFLQPQVRPQSATMMGAPDSSRLVIQPERISLREAVPASSHFTLGRQSEQPQQPMPLHVREHISHIQNDNASLMRRLNLVHQELERINREKGELQAQLTHWMRQSTEAYDVLNKDDNVDRVNKYMKDDLIYERERNIKLKEAIQDFNTQIMNMSDEIRELERDQELMIRQNQESTYIIQKQMTQISDLEKEQYFNQERIKEASRSIDGMRVDCSDLDQQKYAIRQAIEEVSAERNELIERVTVLSRQFEATVQDITQERQLLEEENSHHAKFVTAKIIFKQLNQMYLSKMLSGFQEIATYTNFDSKCNQKMKSLAKLLEKAGSTKLKITMAHWFSNALKPVESRVQSAQLSGKVGGLRLTSKFYRLWRNAFKQRIQSYESKTHSIDKIWARFVNEARVEKQRSFRIWKEVFSQFKLKKFRIRHLLWKRFFKQASIAMSAWKNHNSYYESQLRLGLLTQDFSHQQYQAIMFNGFNQQSQIYKRKRHSRLQQTMKAWNDYLAYQKYLMSQNLIASRFQSEVFTGTIKACFDAFKQNKQVRKLHKVHSNLHSDELVRIQELTNGNKHLMQQRYRVNVTRGCEAIKVKLQKRLWSYLNHWRQLNVEHFETLRTSVKDKIIKVYMNQIRVGFNRWKLLQSQNKTLERKYTIQTMHTEQVTLQNEVFSMNGTNEIKLDEHQQQQQRHLLKCVEGFERRFQHIALGRWRDKVNDRETKEQGAFTLMRRLRLRLLRKTIDLYIEGVAYSKKVQKEEERCAMYNRIRDERLKALALNAWTIFKNRHQTAKDYWYRIFLSLDLSMKRLSVKKWKEVSQLRVEKELKGHENQVIETIEDLNREIGELDSKETEQKQVIEEKVKTLTTQGQRILSNAFARFYTVNQTRGFEKWREFVEFERNKQRLLEKATSHIKKSEFYMVRSALKNWIQNTNILERKDQVKKETMRVNDTIFQTKLQLEQYASDRNTLNKGIEEEKAAQNIASTKLQKTVKLIVKTVHKNHYTSQRRYIFQQWGDYVRREVYFINAIKNVLQKSLWNEGFQAIKNASRDNQLYTNQEDVLNRFFTVVGKAVKYNAFSVWRSGDYAKVKTITHETNDEVDQRNDIHSKIKDKIKTHNALRAEKMILTDLKINTLKAWSNAANYLKVEKEKQLLCRNEVNASRQRQAIYKWRARKQVTKERRDAFNKLSSKLHQMRLSEYFKAMQVQYFRQKELIARLSNLATVMDNQMLLVGFNGVKSYSRAKAFVFTKRKENASIWLAESLKALFRRKTNEYMTELRIRCINKRKVDTIKKLTISNTVGKQMRAVFQTWREQQEKVTLSKELYEEGPVREEDFNYKSELRNIKEFMNEEGYDDQDQGKALNTQLDRQKSLLLKSVRRLQHFNDPNYLKPKVLDRWRQFVHIKRLFRYWLGFVDKRAELVKSDLHQAFDKWKAFHASQYNSLTVQNKDHLNKKAVHNNKVLDTLSTEIVEKESTIDHLNAQRETLLDNYIKAQRLALALWVHRQRNSVHQAFMKWQGNAKLIRNRETSTALKRNLNTLEALKLRIQEFEAVNETYASENEELRQFSLDGYDIAKNVQVLSGEREVLSVDLADKAQVIRKLLDENEALTRKLQKAQEQAQTLIRSTMRRGGDRGGSAGYHQNAPSTAGRSVRS